MQPISALVKARVERIVVENELLRAGFAAFPYLVMKDKALSLGARMTYAFLLMYAWQEGSCFPGQVKLAEEMGLSERQLRRYLYELSENAYIRIERADKRFNNTYILLDKKPSKLKAKKVRFCA
jgi:AraC-like DNA-binding protein